MNSRRVAIKILQLFDQDQGSIDHIIDTQLDASGIDHRDRRFVFELVYGVLRHKLRLDYVITSYLDSPNIKSLDEEVMRILRLGAYQIILLDKVPSYAAVNEAVEEAKAHPASCHQAGLVNALLRNIIKNIKHLPLPDAKDLVVRLSVEYSHPEWMVRRWLERYGLGKTKKLLTFNNTRPDIFLRRKIRGISRQKFEVETRDICDTSTGFMNLYYRISQPVQLDLLPVLADGLCGIQAPSSGWATAMLDVQPGQCILDMCSAPGGKTALISELTGDLGSVCSCDRRFKRILLVADTVETMKLTRTYPVVADGRHPPFAGVFDKVLLDAPCSGTGVLHRHPDARCVKTEAGMKELTVLQRSLLDSAATLVGEGGVIVYSTCSLEPEENEHIVEQFIGGRSDFVLDKPPEIVMDRYVDMKGYLRILPHEHGLDGMFAARLRKIA